jgi:membrane protease YdiL (CAAX protease family)
MQKTTFIKKSAAIRIPLVIGIAGLIFMFSTLVMDRLVEESEYIRSISFLRRTSRHTTMLILSLMLILLVNGGRLAGYGFRWSRKIHFVRIIAFSLLLSLAGNLAAQVFDLAPRRVFGFAAQPLLDKMVYLWVWSSISEEVFTRGLIQGYLDPFRHVGIKIQHLFLSLPVITGALVFGGMHFILLTFGLEFFRVLYLVILTTLLGLYAGYQKERTNSLVAAVIIHLFFNMGGSLYGLLSL